MIKYSNLKKEEIDEFREVLGKFDMLHDFNEKKVIEKYIAKYPDLVIVAKEDKKIIGTILGQGSGSILGSLWSIAVLEDYRGKGIGRILMNKMTERLVKKYKCLWVYLMVRDGNPAINLYKNIGFISDKMYSYGIWDENLENFLKS